MNHLLFIYGTLRKDLREGMFHLLSHRGRFVGYAEVTGRLFDLGDYPGLVISRACHSPVRGEVYALHDPPRTFGVLDAYEGCGAHDPIPHEFARSEVTLVLDTGITDRAWAYLYTGAVDRARPIESGDYLDARTERTA